MKLLLYGVSHHSTPIEIRENYAIEEENVPKQLLDIKQFSGVHEVVILTTCNRTEYYLYIDQTEFLHGEVLRYLADHTGYAISEVISTSYGKSNLDAAKHLFSVASGLDSSIIGETQILSQVKASMNTALAVESSGPILNSLFNKAIAFSKRMHHKTKIEQLSYNPGSAAVQLFKNEWTDLINKQFLIVGTGDMARLTAKSLYYKGARHVMIAGRNAVKAAALATSLKEWSGKLQGSEQTDFWCVSTDLSALTDKIEKVDGIVVATKAQSYLVTAEHMEQLAENQLLSPKIFVDLSVPRNVDPELKHFAHVEVFDMDKISSRLSTINERKEQAIQQIESSMEEELESFSQWFQERRAVPYIHELRNKVNSVQEKTMNSLQNKLPELTDKEIEVINMHLMSVVNQLSRHQVKTLKELAKKKSRNGSTDALEQFAQQSGLVERKEEMQEVVKGEKENTEIAGKEVIFSEKHSTI